MTVDEASQIYYINLEIKKIQLELARLKESRTYYKPIIMSDMPRGGEHIDVTDEYLDRIQRLEDMLSYNLKKLQHERERFEGLLCGVEDAETRLILRLRCVNNMHWEEIGAELGMDRRTASRKFYAFFESCPQCPRDM